MRLMVCILCGFPVVSLLFYQQILHDYYMYLLLLLCNRHVMRTCDLFIFEAYELLMDVLSFQNQGNLNGEVTGITGRNQINQVRGLSKKNGIIVNEVCVNTQCLLVIAIFPVSN